MKDSDLQGDISSYPPLGAVSIAFMGIASYMVYAGIYNTAAHAARGQETSQRVACKYRK